MKKLFALFTLAVLMVLALNINAYSQEEPAAAPETTATEVAETTAVAQPATTLEAEEAPEAQTEKGDTFHQILKEKFIQGGPGFMAVILLTLILGLALAIERVVYLNLSTTNTKKLLGDIEGALGSGGIEGAKEVCRNTRGPVAGIFYQGLDRHDEGLDVVEKAIVSYGSVMMGRLERGLSWISLFIALAPMLGFLGTVIGMVQAFDAIEVAGDISPTIVAGGIKVALLTTVFGLIVAIILQIFYNLLVSKIDSLVNDMEDSSIHFMDIMIRNNK